MQYGSGSVVGVISEDTVCLSENEDAHCVNKFQFLDVISQHGLDMLKVSGLVGLSPKRYEYAADLFIEKFKDVDAIDEAVFSMSIAKGSEQSKMTFGGYDTDQFATGPLKWYQIP